jgi:hypothetical protein
MGSVVRAAIWNHWSFSLEPKIPVSIFRRETNFASRMGKLRFSMSINFPKSMYVECRKV